MFADVNDIAPEPALTSAFNVNVAFEPVEPAVKVTPWLLPDVTAASTVSTPSVVVNVTAPFDVVTPVTVLPATVIEPIVKSFASVNENAPVPVMFAANVVTSTGIVADTEAACIANPEAVIPPAPDNSSPADSNTLLPVATTPAVNTKSDVPPVATNAMSPEPPAVTVSATVSVPPVVTVMVPSVVVTPVMPPVKPSAKSSASVNEKSFVPVMLASNPSTSLACVNTAPAADTVRSPAVIVPAV